MHLRPLISAATRLTRKFFRLMRCVLLSLGPRLDAGLPRRPLATTDRSPLIIAPPPPRRSQTHSRTPPHAQHARCRHRRVLASHGHFYRMSPHTLDTVLPSPSMRRAAVLATPAHAVVLHPASTHATTIACGIPA
ncbi:hypothetical protein DFH08DRAFT_432335 [Mycena albidolilacea]|uniref:Uncharacterized protein n=1 Tax=Mycena albidolilacea TaxID=1033008 RepID=A0AAD6ZA08_9AGAR|nr:hypothetical protein DFH08DRAFT_432335 [Mycena albidolilacea]